MGASMSDIRELMRRRADGEKLSPDELDTLAHSAREFEKRLESLRKATAHLGPLAAHLCEDLKELASPVA